jgi:hypothetical protein
LEYTGCSPKGEEIWTAIGVVMIHRLSPILNDEERKLLNTAPEECLRRVVQRGALPLNQITDDLPPRVAAAVWSIATGERLAALPRVAAAVRSIAAGERLANLDVKDVADQSPRRSKTAFWSYEEARNTLPGHPQLVCMLDEQILTPDEALEAAQAIDHILGRYLTGTKYAVP